MTSIQLPLMNLLFILLKNIDSIYREKLSSLISRGTMGAVWVLINEQAVKGEFNKKEILAKTDISSSHLDKITSELLAKCYSLLFAEDSIALLNFLSSRVALIKLFYNELARQTKIPANMADKQQMADLMRHCFRMIHTNMPIAYREEKASMRLAKLYTSLFKGALKREAEFYVGFTLLFEKMEKLFAAAEIKEKADLIEKEFDMLGPPLGDFNEEVVFEYYWAKIYFPHAIENFALGLDVAKTAVSSLKKYKSEQNKLNILRIELKMNEFLYYLSRFEEAFDQYHRIIHSPMFEKVPDRSYQVTKYTQLCLITGHLDEAGKVLREKINSMGDKVKEMIIVRDIVTYVKYCLFVKDFDTAFRFIQLGFEKNPKAKYFQYELELRNLQTAYFYLSGQEDVALEMCNKHIKFLRNNGYTTVNSDYPHYYVLVKAMFDKNTKDGLSARHQNMLDRYQIGSFAVYGRLLLKMLKR